ncbi:MULTISPECIES: hypothetical protein [Cupriavidus]|uniref:hypothetical protein n=1 Tax=Cupriavidus TaxID=106589 RepID=UPI00165AAE2A|nr:MULTISPECIES: hypothetical protein [Cupriavidus]MCA7085712.1 hypothetical protein [Cupriavidus sp. DB3]
MNQDSGDSRDGAGLASAAAGVVSIVVPIDADGAAVSGCGGAALTGGASAAGACAAGADGASVGASVGAPVGSALRFFQKLNIGKGVHTPVESIGKILADGVA